MTMRIDPCPFCGNKNVKTSIVNRTQFGTTRYVVSIYCPYCHARGPRTIYHEEHEKDVAIAKAIEKWNRRVTE